MAIVIIVIIAMVIVVMKFVTMAIVTMVTHTFQIFESAVYPPDDTWHQNVNKNDRGSKRINKAVSQPSFKAPSWCSRCNLLVVHNHNCTSLCPPFFDQVVDKVLSLYRKAFNESKYK